MDTVRKIILEQKFGFLHFADIKISSKSFITLTLAMKTVFEYPLALAKTLLIQNRYLSY